VPLYEIHHLLMLLLFIVSVVFKIIRNIFMHIINPIFLCHIKHLWRVKR
jgi:hypothetical protein